MSRDVQDQLAVALAAQHTCDTLLTIPLCNRCRQSAAAVLPVVERLIAEAEQRGRDSVGLGDFLPDPCGDEHRARASHIAETYGDWLSCTLRRGHGGEHEHEDSGVNWPAS